MAIKLADLLKEDNTEEKNVFIKDVIILNKLAFKIAGVIVQTKTGFTGYLKKYSSGTLPATGFRSQSSFHESYGDTLYKTEKPITKKEDCIKQLESAVNSIKIK